MGFQIIVVNVGKVVVNCLSGP